MRPWPLELAEGLTQALANPGAPALLRLVAATLRPDESGAVFVDADRELRLLGAVPGDEPFRQAPVRALARRAAAAQATDPVSPETPVSAEWPAALACRLPGRPAALVVLGRGPSIASETRARLAWLVPAAAALVLVEETRHAARRADMRLARLRQLLEAAAPGRDLGSLGREILAVACGMADADAGALWIRRSGRGALELAAARPPTGSPGPVPALRVAPLARLLGPYPLCCPPHPLARARELLRAPDLSSAALAAIEQHGRLVGLIAVARGPGARPLDPEQAEVLVGLAELAAIPVASATLRARLGERARQLAAARRLGAAVAGHPTVEELFRAASRELRRVVAFDVAALVIHGEDRRGDAVTLVGELGRLPRSIERGAEPGERRLDRTTVVDDAVADPRAVPPFLRNNPAARSLLVTPLRAAGRVVGALVVGSRTPRRFGRREARLVAPLADLVAIGVRDARRAPLPAAPGRPPGQGLPEPADDGGIGRLASALAHEIRNPLAVVGTTIQYLRDRRLVAEEHRPLLEAADQKVREVTEALEGMLALARPLELRPEPTALEPLLAEVAEFLRPRAAERSIEVRIDAADRSAAAMVDRRYLGQALLRLAAHGLEGMAAGGQLLLAAGAAAEPGAVRLTVADTGGGVDARELATLFEPFEGAGRHGGGRGLDVGLAVTRRIVEAHGGRVTAASEPGRGTIFTVTLPAAPRARRVAAAAG
jgi:signal transduction histidine kinase